MIPSEVIALAEVLARMDGMLGEDFRPEHLDRAQRIYNNLRDIGWDLRMDERP